jgi:RimJ/RimL family protein N-acetyltransferase
MRRVTLLMLSLSHTLDIHVRPYKVSDAVPVWEAVRESLANLGYWVRTTATRRVGATRAVQSIREWGFRHTDLIRFRD